jgi:hypothetical protein
MAGARLIGNQYRLLEPVGAGGMGRVWRAWDIPLDREVAVKEIVLPPGMTEETWAQVYQRTVREARAAARIRHPGVATVYGMSEQGEAPPWIAMEFVPGCSLDRMLSEDGPLPPVRTAEIGRQVLAALASGHAAGVRHRDLKPANVMITPEGRAVLTDFGIARMIDDPRLTTAGVAIGTPRYMSPERILDRDDDSPAADLWALGATLFAAIRGQGPYDGYREITAACLAITTEEPPEIPEAGPLAGLIRALMSRDPARRPDAIQAAQELDAAIALMRGRPAPDPASLFPPRERTRRYDFQETRTVPPGPPRHAAVPASGRRWLGRKPIAIAAAAAVLAAAGVMAAVLPGRGGAGDTFRLAAAINVDGHPELFAVTRVGTLDHAWTYSTRWAVWHRLPTQAITFTGAPAAIRDASKRMELFARTAAGTIVRYYQSQPGFGGWDGPEQLVGANGVTSNPSVLSRGDGTLEVFARLADGSIGYDAQLTPGPSASWTGWRSIGGGSTASAPVAMVNNDGSPEVFARASDGSLVHDYYLRGKWSGWQRLAPGNVFTGTPTVAKNTDGRLEVFVRTPAGTLDHLWQEAVGSGPWSDLQSLGSGLRGDPVVCPMQGGRLELFAELSNGGIGYITQQPTSSTGWSGWKSLPGRADYNRVDVFVRTDVGITDFRSPTGTDWTDATQIAGSF